MKMTKLSFCILAIIICFNSKAKSYENRLKKIDTVFVSSENIKVQAEVGILQVPENRANKNSRIISVKYVRLKSTSLNPKDPLIYLEGGGSSCTWQAEDPDYLSDWLPYLAISDVILFDQRGTTDKDLTWLWMDEYPEGFLVNEKAAGDHWQKMCSKALESFKEKGIDVTGYSVLENAKDIELLRKELSIEKYSILGFSFGTHLGMTLIKMYGEKINNAVLAASDGLNHSFNFPSLLDLHFKKISELAKKDLNNQNEIPDLNKLLEKVLIKLEQQPVLITVKNPLTGNDMEVKVGPFGLSLILRLDIDDASDIPVVPRLLFSIDQGDNSILRWFVQKRIVYAFGLPGNGLTQGIASGASKKRWKRIEKEAEVSQFKNVVNFPFYPSKKVWPEVTLEVDFTKKLTSEVRTLFLSGELDCRTPSSQTEEIKNGFKNGTHLVVKNAGHEQILSNIAIQKAIGLFLNGKDVSNVKATHKSIKFIPLEGDCEEVSHPSLE